MVLVNKICFDWNLHNSFTVYDFSSPQKLSYYPDNQAMGTVFTDRTYMTSTTDTLSPTATIVERSQAGTTMLESSVDQYQPHPDQLRCRDHNWSWIYMDVDPSVSTVIHDCLVFWPVAFYINYIIWIITNSLTPCMINRLSIECPCFAFAFVPLIVTIYGTGGTNLRSVHVTSHMKCLQ